MCSRLTGPASVVVAFASLAYAPNVVFAQDAGVSFRLAAYVQPFCKITTDFDLDRPIELINGGAQLGNVREVCNTQNGFRLVAAFQNVSSGELVAGAEALPIAADGSTVIQSDRPRARTRTWSLANAAPQDTSQPVFVRLTMTPI